MEFVDWRVAQRVGELIAGTPPFGTISSERVEPMAHDFAVRVAAYSGLRPPAELPRLELVDIERDVFTRPLFVPLPRGTYCDR